MLLPNRLVRFALAILALYGIILYKYHSSHSYDSSNSINTSTKISSFTYPPALSKSNKTTAILLQQSPVAIFDQISRLQVIDELSWAKWTDDSTSNVQVFASLPQILNGTSSKQHHRFLRIHPIHLTYPANMTTNAFYNLVRGILMILVSNPQTEWLVLANDHTFMIPTNLQSFLRRFDPSVPFYSGNRLQRGVYKKNFILYFASGGAGIVISHVSAKLFLLSLTISGSAILDKVLSLMENQDSTSYMIDQIATGCSKEIVEILEMDTNLWCMILAIKHWSSQSRAMTNPSEFVIKLSSKASLRLGLESKVQLIMNPSGLPDQAVKTTVDNVKASCSPTTDWDILNPALVLAFCLQYCYQTRFTSSTVNRLVINMTYDALYMLDTSSLVAISANDSNQTVAHYERFNCFGVVRTLYGDVDDWYPLAKLEPGDTAVGLQALFSPVPIPVARDVVSFHYISQKESELLYKVLSKQILIESWEELQEAWPKAGTTEVGVYSRARFHDNSEIKRLHEFVTKYVLIE